MVLIMAFMLNAMMPMVPMIGEQTLINTYTGADQDNPAVTSLSDGGYLITWSSNGQDGSGYGIYGQRYDVNGAVSGAEFRINTMTYGNQNQVELTELASGSFVVIWVSDNGNGNLRDIYGQVYDASGNTVNGGEFLINTETTEEQFNSNITALTDGGFVITWQSNLQDGDGYGVYMRQFDSLGHALSGDVLLSQTTLGDQTNPILTQMSDGGFFAAWNNGSDLYGRHLGQDGTPRDDEFLIDAGTSGTASLNTLENGDVVVTWSDIDAHGTGVYSKILELKDPDQTLVGTTGDDLLIGGSGDDTLVGNAGDDLLTGGLGEDVFVISESEVSIALAGTVERVENVGLDTLTDFTSVDDTIELSVVDFGFDLGNLIDEDTYFEIDALGGIITDNGAAIVIVGSQTGNAGVEVWYTEDAAAMDTIAGTGNSYQIANVDGVNAAEISAADFIVK